jgi:hypothetical protein
MRIQDAMTRDVHIANPAHSIREAARIMAEIDAGTLPVGENDRLVGMITDRDIAVRAVAAGKGPDRPVRDVMSQEVCYCFEDQEIDEAAANMADQKIRRLPVVSREKRLVGSLLRAADPHRDRPRRHRDDPLYGQQEGRHFHGYYDCHYLTMNACANASARISSQTPTCYTSPMATKSLEQRIDALTSIVEKGFAAVVEDIARIDSRVDKIEHTVATKDQVLALQTQVNSIERQLRDTKTEVRLGNLEDKVFGRARA